MRQHRGLLINAFSGNQSVEISAQSRFDQRCDTSSTGVRLTYETTILYALQALGIATVRSRRQDRGQRRKISIIAGKLIDSRISLAAVFHMRGVRIRIEAGVLCTV
jgi:hypothetical protein